MSSIVDLLFDEDFEGKNSSNSLDYEFLAQKIIARLSDPDFRLRFEEVLREEIEQSLEKSLMYNFSL